MHSILSQNIIKALPGLVFDFEKRTKHTSSFETFVLTNTYQGRSYRTRGLVCALFISKPSLVFLESPYSVPEVNELAVSGGAQVLV